MYSVFGNQLHLFILCVCCGLVSVYLYMYSVSVVEASAVWLLYCRTQECHRIQDMPLLQYNILLGIISFGGKDNNESYGLMNDQPHGGERGRGYGS